MSNSRIQLLGMDVYEKCTELSGCVPGSIVALGELKKWFRFVDPAYMGGIHEFLIDLDMLEIHDEKIHQLYKHLCESNVSLFMAVIKACKYGVLGMKKSTLHQVLSNQGKNFDAYKVLAYVRKRFPKFNYVQ